MPETRVAEDTVSVEAAPAQGFEHFQFTESWDAPLHGQPKDCSKVLDFEVSFITTVGRTVKK
jgi:hypothetical protein